MTHAWQSRSLRALLVLPAASLVAPAPAVRAQAPAPAYAAQDEDYAGESADRYAQVKVLEGDVRIRKAGEAEEALSRGIPVTEGDVVESRGRGVLQLGDGSRVAFGSNTRFQVAGLFTGREGSRQVLLRLDYGRLRLSASGGDARFRVDTPTGTASLAERASATVEVDRDRVTRFKLHAGRGSFSNERDQARLTAGERLTIYSVQDSLDRIRSFNTYEMDGFDEWCDDVLVPRRSRSAEYVPREVRHYADDLDEYGEWVDVEDVGHVWRPRVSIEWRPYWRGRWGAYAGGLTWVSDDPWGYVTFHHGRWGWTSRWGWYWIPGVFYSPAWVAWNWNSSYYGWAPLGYWNHPVNWGYGAWGGGHCWNVVQVHHLNTVNLHNRVVVDRAVIAGFSGTGTTTWTGAGSRGVTPPWRTSPLIATGSEFRNPAQLTRALDRQVQGQRLADYGRQLQASGHVLQSRAHVSRPVGGSEGTAPATGGGRPVRPFEDRTLRTPGPRNREMVDRPPTGDREDATPRLDRGQGRGREDRRPDPQDRRPDPQDRPGDRSRESSRPVDRTPPNRDFVDRPSRHDRDETPRPDRSETPRERRFEERRPDPPRERPREERREWRMDREDRPAPTERPSSPPPRTERPSSPPPPRMERPSPPPPPRMERPSSPPPSPPSRPESREIRRG
jgi:hypothetical protein